MAIKHIEKAEWASYFDRFSQPLMRHKRVDYAEIRVFSPEIGAQRETQWLPLIGITFDRKSDLLEIAVEHLDHLIYHPKEIYVDEAGEGIISSMEITQEDGRKELIELR